MSQKISKNLRVIVLRGGIELSLEKERADKIIALMEQRKFIEVDGRIINVVDIIGIFSPEDLEASIRRRNGQWQDKRGDWHDRGDRVCKCGNVLPFGMKCGFCS